MFVALSALAKEVVEVVEATAMEAARVKLVRSMKVFLGFVYLAACGAVGGVFSYVRAKNPHYGVSPDAIMIKVVRGALSAGILGVLIALLGGFLIWMFKRN